MKALAFAGKRRLDMVDIPTPLETWDRVVIKVEAAGICGSDLEGYRDDNGRRVVGQIMGHEASGTVVAASDKHAQMIGRRVTFTPIVGCSTCPQCRRGADNLCARRRLIGVHPDFAGAFAEYVQVPVGNLFPVSSALSGALVEPLSVAYQALRNIGVVDAGRVLVLGAGTIGALTAVVARHHGGHSVDIFDPVAWKTEWLKPLDIGALASASLTDPSGADRESPYAAVFDCVGSSRSMDTALAMVRPGGRIHVVGMASVKIDLNIRAAITNEVSFTTSYAYRHGTVGEVVDLLPGIEGKLNGMAVTTTPLEGVPSIFEQLLDPESRLHKVMITP